MLLREDIDWLREKGLAINGCFDEEKPWIKVGVDCEIRRNGFGKRNRDIHLGFRN